MEDNQLIRWIHGEILKIYEISNGKEFDDVGCVDIEIFESAVLEAINIIKTDELEYERETESR